MMTRKLICAAIALGLGAASAVQAQDYDDRWYVAPTIGYVNNDDDRLSDSGTMLFGLGVGRYLAPNTSLDVFVDRTQRGANEEGTILFGTDDAMESTMIGVALRYYFGASDWQPYVMGGVGMSNHRSGVEDGWDPAVQAGGGLQYSFSSDTKFRAELFARHDMDGDSVPFADNFTDVMLTLGVTMALGAAPEAPAPMESEPARVTPPVDCSTLDDDRDGVNNCDDKCADTAAGTVVGPDGCPQEVVIDLRGVEFLFDRPTPGQTSVDNAGLLPGSIEILEQAVDVLTRYPNIKVEVAGHTDSIGSDEYNQSLSERRATVVYGYLTGKGIDASRLVGPNGYGESRPIDTNDTKEGRQRNRRTELAVQK
jgi:OOP family OmpA-OmpF porin